MVPRLLATGTALSLLLLPLPLRAQEPGGWALEGEVGGAVFFGNTSQTTFTTRLGAEMADSIREVAVGGQFNYGEARDEEGNDFVSRRSWQLTSSYDRGPFARWSPFLQGKVESALERRIDLRWDLGFGGKYLIQRSDRGRVDLSATVLAERTVPRSEAGEEVENEFLARWSVRFRVRRSWDEDRLTLRSENHYRPAFSHAGDFTFASTSSVSFALNSVVSLRLSFEDTYDSEAVTRGATTNNDGQIVFSVLSSF